MADANLRMQATVTDKVAAFFKIIFAALAAALQCLTGHRPLR